jgi:hypothetical protein
LEPSLRRTRRHLRWLPWTASRSWLGGLALLLAQASAHAYVECTVTPKRYYISSSGYLWVSWVEGGAGTIEGNPAGAKSVLASVMLAISSGRQVIVRYPDGTACTATQAIDGLWLTS